jgi:ABC-type transport system substrate-binding protein
MLDDANYNTPTWEGRDGKYVEIHKYLIENWYPWAPFRQSADVYIANSWVENFHPVPLRGTSSAQTWTLIDLERE